MESMHFNQHSQSISMQIKSKPCRGRHNLRDCYAHCKHLLKEVLQLDIRLQQNIEGKGSRGKRMYSGKSFATISCPCSMLPCTISHSRETKNVHHRPASFCAGQP